MSAIDELIAELCPDGVEYRKLDEVCLIETGRLNAKAAVENGTYCFFTTAEEISKIDTYRWDTEALLIAGNANVGSVKHFKGKFEAYQRTYVLTQFVSDIQPRYLYHYLEAHLKDYLADKSNSAAMTYIVLSTLQDFPIPVPPIEVQREIVRILDTFAALTDTLTEELDCRRQQYAYYRDRLLSRESLEALDDKPVEMKRLGDVVQFVNGRAYKKEELLDSGKYRGLSVGNFFTNDSWYFSNLELDEEKYCNDGDLLYAWSASFGPKIWHGPKAIFHYHIWRIDFDDEVLDRNYLFHFLANDAVDIRDSNSTTHSTMAHVSMAQMKKRMIFVPSIEAQQKVVDILDRFDALTTSLTDGLPAEIEARRQQYEYYRASLLDFPRKEAAAS